MDLQEYRIANGLCTKCGKPMNGSTKRYCEECREKDRRFHEAKYEKPPRKSHLEENAKKAKEAGMSYGQWQAMQYMKGQKK